MNRSDATVRLATSDDIDNAGGVLANAFAEDPIFEYLLGDRHDKEARLRPFFDGAIRAELGKANHLTEIVESGQAVAVWHEVDDWKTPPLALARSLPTAMRTFGKRLPRALRLLSKADAVHPSEPHRYLAFIGAHRDSAGRGFGSALISSMLDRCDSEGIAAYLESTNPANNAWYARFGFESRGPVPLPQGAPVLTAMWREPR